MKRILLISMAMLAAPAFAQTATDSAADDAEMQRAQMAPFFTDDTMSTARSSEEINAQWGTMSVEDQATLRTRCNGMMSSSGGDSADAGSSGGDTGGTDAGATDGSSEPSTSDSAEMTDPALRSVCDVINAM